MVRAAVAGSGAKAERARALGADEVIDYAEQRFEEIVRDADVVFDTVGGDALAAGGARIEVRVDLDLATEPDVRTGLGFFDHMLEQLGKHSGFALYLHCQGDTHVDEHHTVEDCAIALGQALRQALGDKRGIGRYGFTLPMDEALASAALDLSGRAYCVFDGCFARDRVGDLPTEMVSHFFRSLCEALGANLHLRVTGDNAHHMVEACFKVVARALREAVRREGSALPSTKGVL